ncbi:TnsA endonuclease N-terminal domain-containing protein [Metabacillus arenae]|uniref:Heteromeric transposase endonuclease subunit TnsA n=1 Tax=Metabacillus arenae TaxID=2771434 RepID=A0A926RZ49_9BACI|nr:TnsA endonuclease N-terminal domain-containing protein [Metabacillus arenae]MBD1382445.1 heteromeric transposase endonuclease subunit TnsA [Metabacillus arenae]
MSKRKRTSNIEKWIKEGRGAGIGADYQPWLKIQDVSSLGRSTRLKGIKTGRQHEFLSDLERNYFYLTEFSDSVFDIREQFPLLPHEETILIADELGIEHPRHPKTGEYVVMTTDFVLTVENRNQQVDVARTVKSKEDLFNERITQKFEIEREYWSRRDTNWAIVTEEEIDKIYARNISYIHSYYTISHFENFQGMLNLLLEDLKLEYIKRLLNPIMTIREISNQFDKDTNLASGSGLSIFYHLIINKAISVDLSQELRVDEIIEIVSIENNILEKVKYG